ncbi:tRNA lysidine(34) synthetase TilS [Rugosimonospora africana]|uniref:tRNA(Ile)-lysidine synthase n=1 Tax=Rugosimonospora africana TaxID=556532 RepID=A0A8J3QX67_9ACTN|nr:tRNA lysidine(34) synthetase TilS [Rugosimonospora africana]GIH18181.1 tRNA(Ile)-lysidine synthase [Rugosimonospora africana]
MAPLPPAVAACRLAVRESLAGWEAGGLVLAACSGGSDSLALAAALAFVAPRAGLRAGLVTVDHGLQPGSAERAAEVAEWGDRAGLTPAVVAQVTVRRAGGPEAAARTARYQALAEVAARVSATAVLLGHTRDDQAETVLLALTRGGGPRGIAGMPQRRIMHGVTFVRPFLDVSRAQTRAACADLGLKPWEDPHNADPAYTRSRLRAAMPVLVDTLGPDIVDNLARTARLVAADVEALDALAASAGTAAANPDGSLDVPSLAGLPSAVRTRVLRGYALRLGVPGAALSAAHIDALDALVMNWHGQGPVALPGGILVGRGAGRLASPP